MFYYNPPLYYICSIVEVFSRSTHCSWSNPISFWIAYSWDESFLVPSNLIHSVPRTSRKTLLSFDYHFIHCVVAVSQFFCKRMKIFLGAQKQQHFEFLIVFFKCSTISHSLNPGATPWYFTSLYYNVTSK